MLTQNDASGIVSRVLACRVFNYRVFNCHMSKGQVESFARIALLPFAGHPDKIDAVTFDNISPTDISPTSNASQRWNNFVAASPWGDVMQCLEWGDVKRPDWQPIPLAIETNGELQATALVLKRRLPLGRSILYVPRGPILDWNDRETTRQIVRKLRGLARAHRAILIKIDPAVPSSTRFGNDDLSDILRELGFISSPDATGGFGGTQPRCVMKTDVAGDEAEVLTRFHSKWRYNIRYAAKKGVVVKTDCTRDDIETFHELYATTAQRDGFVGRPLSYFQKMLDVLEPQGLAKLFLTFHDGQPLSGAICFLLPPQCWYVYGASSNEKRNLMPNHAMQWAMMQWARENGCTIYDFRGVADESKTPSPTLPLNEGKGDQTQKVDDKSGEKADNHLQGLNRFKEGFGAQLVDYSGEYDLILNPRFYWLWTNLKPKIIAALKKHRT